MAKNTTVNVRSAYDRMMSKVRRPDDPDGCWLFQGALDQNGHGNVYVKRNGKKTCDKAHKVSYDHHNRKPLPPGLVHRHTCDVANCVNPRHLEPGTQRMNVADMILRDRAANQYGPYTSYVDASDSIQFREPAAVQDIKGCAIAQGEDFCIKPFATELEEVA